MARTALSNAVLIILLFTFGCSSSTTPTFTRETIEGSIVEICKKEHHMDVVTKLLDSTLWVYLPLKDIFTTPDKPTKYIERFEITESKDEFKDDIMRLEYAIATKPEQEKYQQMKIKKEAAEKMSNLWMVLRRILFSMGHRQYNGPRFFVVVTADIQNGFKVQETFYYLDVKKVFYGYISTEEYQHRILQDVQLAPELVGDTEGKGLVYTSVTMKDFILEQIQNRIKMKFQKPEVDKDVDIDKEVLRAVTYTVKTYDFKDFSTVELINLLTNRTVSLNQAALWDNSHE